MLCGECGKNEAEVFLKQIVNNQVSQSILCRDCARKKGVPSSYAQNLFLELLAGLGGLLPGPAPAARARLQCPTCGFNYDQLSKTGRLGCPECYQAFRAPIKELIARIHGTPRTAAPPAKADSPPKAAPKKRPAASPPDAQRLRNELKTAIDREDFEEAARLRDELRRLEPEG